MENQINIMNYVVQAIQKEKPCKNEPTGFLWSGDDETATKQKTKPKTII